MIEFVVSIIVYSLAAIVAILCSVFLFAFIVSFINVWIKGRRPTIKTLDELTEEERELLKETLRKDPANWIQLGVEKEGETLYFYDMVGDKQKFLFQCKTFEEMLENLNAIRGNRGVKIDANMVKDLGLTEFFMRDGVRLEEKDE